MGDFSDAYGPMLLTACMAVAIILNFYCKYNIWVTWTTIYPLTFIYYLVRLSSEGFE
jgi:hypothetical protein